MDDNSIIIGAGFSGLSAGIYARMNGYQTILYEMHDLLGGLCTAWKREGYTIDGCIHWLVGSSPKSSMHRAGPRPGCLAGIIESPVGFQHNRDSNREDQIG